MRKAVAVTCSVMLFRILLVKLGAKNLGDWSPRIPEKEEAY
jgi:hypothetical protein